MLLGRLFGWSLLGAAMLMASGDVVLALGPADQLGQMAGVLLGGRTLSAFPAWLTLAPMGGTMLYLFRRRRRYYFINRKVRP